MKKFEVINMAKVKIYTTPTCTWCVKAKEYFKENNVEFTEADVSTDRSAAEEMVRKSRQMGVPVIEINKKIIIGFDKGAIESALKSNGSI
jgi:glutaredoxin-like YruB-family protein